jgi:2-oxoglutarate ferredoxin oxidoreductase subunit beta
VDAPFNPVSLALGAEATFVARTMDSDRSHLTEVLRQAARHRGAALVEIYQNCPIFNDGAFDVLKDRESGRARMVQLEHGKPIRFGPPAEDGAGRLGLVRGQDGGMRAAEVAEVGAEAVIVHDAHAEDPAQAFAVSRLDDATMAHVPFGVFRSVSRPTYDDLVRGQVDAATAGAGGVRT